MTGNSKTLRTCTESRWRCKAVKQRNWTPPWVSGRTHFYGSRTGRMLLPL